MEGMWRNGSITANAMVCLEGTTDWVSIRDEMASIEAMRPKVKRWDRRVYSEITERTYSVTTAVMLSLLITGLGHFYCNATGRGALFLLAQVVAFVFGLFPLMLLIWAVAPFDAARCARG